MGKYCSKFNEFKMLNESKKVEFNVGDVVYDKTHDDYGVVLLGEDHGDIKITSDGNVDASHCTKLSQAKIMKAIDEDKITDPWLIYLMFKLNYLTFDYVNNKATQKIIHNADVTIKNYKLLTNPIELTFLEVDSDTGNYIYNGSDDKKYVSISGIVFTMTKTGEPLSPFRNTVFKKNTPIYNADDRFGRNPKSFTMSV